MKANRTNPTLIQVTENGKVIGHCTCDEFRAYMGNKHSFIQDLIRNYNTKQEREGTLMAVSQVINTAR
jgi:hypothetical protein